MSGAGVGSTAVSWDRKSDVQRESRAPLPFPDPRHYFPPLCSAVQKLDHTGSYRELIFTKYWQTVFVFSVVPTTLSGKGCSSFTDRENGDSAILNNTPRALNDTCCSWAYLLSIANGALLLSLTPLFPASWSLRSFEMEAVWPLRTYPRYLIGPSSLIINPGPLPQPKANKSKPLKGRLSSQLVELEIKQCL